MNLSIYSSSRKCSFLILLPVSQVVQFLFCSGITEMIPLPLCEATYSQLFISSWSIFSSAHSVMADSVTPRTAACHASLSITNSWSLLKLMSIKLVMPSNHLILCCPLLLLPLIFPSIRVFSNEVSLHIRWPKYWSFSFSISPSNEYSGLISFRIDWLDLLTVQGLSRIFSNTTVQKHRFFGTWLSLINSHPYMTTGKTIALTIWIFVSKVMSLLFNTLSVIAFLPRRKRLLISWLQSPSAVILEPQKIKSATVSIVFPSICLEVMEPDAMILVF